MLILFKDKSGWLLSAGNLTNTLPLLLGWPWCWGGGESEGLEGLSSFVDIVLELEILKRSSNEKNCRCCWTDCSMVGVYWCNIFWSLIFNFPAKTKVCLYTLLLAIFLPSSASTQSPLGQCWFYFQFIRPPSRPTDQTVLLNSIVIDQQQPKPQQQNDHKCSWVETK